MTTATELSVRKGDLISFLEKNGCDSAEEVLAALEPHFALADLGTHPLLRLDKKEIIQAVNPLTRKINEVSFIELDNPFEKPGWMKESSHESAIKELLKEALKNLKDLGDDTVEIALDEELGDKLWNVLWNTLGGSFRSALGESLGSEWTNRLGGTSSFTMGIWFHVFIFAGLHLTNDKKEAEKLLPYVQMLAKCLPIGWSNENPGTILIITKQPTG